MKKYVFVLVAIWLATTAQTSGLLEQAESKLQNLLANVGQPPPTQGGIAERIDGGLAQLIANPNPVPQQPSDITCVPLQDCTPLIQKAIDEAADGAVLTVNAGQFLLATPLRIYKPLHLKGQGKFKTVFTHNVNISYLGNGGLSILVKIRSKR